MNIFKKIINWITGATKKINEWLDFGINFTNAVKSIADSTLLDAIVKATPTPLDDVALASVRMYLKKTLKTLKWADLKINELDEDSKAIVLTVVSALAQRHASGNKISIQAALAATPIVYDPKKIEKELVN